MILKHKQAIVTGAASGIGRAAAGALKELGATVIGLDLAPTVDADIPIVQVDLSEESQIIAAVAEAAGRLDNKVTRLIKAACIENHSPPPHIERAAADRMYRTKIPG